ncbi:MAG: hypothetical protein QW197_03060 [Candidatus Aenigmatarchaeota archaeon]
MSYVVFGHDLRKISLLLFAIGIFLNYFTSLIILFSIIAELVNSISLFLVVLFGSMFFIASNLIFVYLSIRLIRYSDKIFHEENFQKTELRKFLKFVMIASILNFVAFLLSGVVSIGMITAAVALILPYFLVKRIFDFGLDKKALVIFITIIVLFVISAIEIYIGASSSKVSSAAPFLAQFSLMIGNLYLTILSLTLLFLAFYFFKYKKADDNNFSFYSKISFLTYFISVMFNSFYVAYILSYSSIAWKSIFGMLVFSINDIVEKVSYYLTLIGFLLVGFSTLFPIYYLSKQLIDKMFGFTEIYTNTNFTQNQINN